MNSRSVVYYGDSLTHHGILGMKWGQRNGPPYPLGSDDHSAAEKKAGWRKSLKTSEAGSTERKLLARRSNEVKFRNETSAAKKVARAALAVSSLGTARWASRFAYRHQKGISALNKAMGVIGAATVVGGAIASSTGVGAVPGSVLIGLGLSTMQSAAIAELLGKPLNDAVYENLYSSKKVQKNSYEKKDSYQLHREQIISDRKAERNKAYDEYDKAIEQIESKYGPRQTLSDADVELQNKAQRDLNKRLADIDEEYANKLNELSEQKDLKLTSSKRY